VELRLGRLQRGEDIGTMLRQSLSRLGQSDSTTYSLQQRGPRFPFQQGKLLRDAGRAHVQGLSYRGYRPATIQLDQELEATNVKHEDDPMNTSLALLN
jgi:hypothetical protein